MLELAIIAAICVGGALGITKILRKSSDYELKLMKKQFKALETYTLELEEDNKSLQNTMNRKERGPVVPDGDILSFLPNVLGDFTNYAPKWLRPFLSNKEIQGAIITKIQENPERFAELFGKLIKKKDEKQTVAESL